MGKGVQGESFPRISPEGRRIEFEYSMDVSVPIRVVREGPIFGDATAQTGILGNRTNGDTYTMVDAGTTGSAFFKDEGMVFCIVDKSNCRGNDIGQIYGWLPMEAVEINQQGQ